ALGDLLLGGRGDRIGDLRFGERVSARVLVLRAFHSPALLVERGAHGGEVAAAAIIVVVKRPRGRLRGLGRIRLLHLERTLAAAGRSLGGARATVGTRHRGGGVGEGGRRLVAGGVGAGDGRPADAALHRRGDGAELGGERLSGLERVGLRLLAVIVPP